MAPKNEVSVWIRAKDLASRTVKGFERNLNALWKTGKNVAKGLAAVTAAATGATYAMGRLSERGARVADIQAAFERSTRGQTNAIEELRKASGGLVSDFELMQRHNQAMALQVTTNAEQTGRLIQMAQGLSRVMGIDLAYGIESVITGIGRLSPRWIDNLGITVDAAKANQDYARTHGLVAEKLTDAQQKQALLNAVLREGERILQDTGSTSSTVGNGWAKLTTAFFNARDELAKMIAKSPEVEAFFAALTQGIDEIVKRLPDAVRKMAGFATTAADVLSGGPAAATRRATLAGFRASPNQERFRDLTQEQLERDMARARAIREDLAARTAGGPRPKMSTVMGGMAGVAAAERAAAEAGQKTVAELNEELRNLDTQIQGTDAALAAMNAELRATADAAAEAAAAERRKRLEESAARAAIGDVAAPRINVGGFGGIPRDVAGAELAARRAHGAAAREAIARGEFHGEKLTVSDPTARAQRVAAEEAKAFLESLEDVGDGFSDVALAAGQVATATKENLLPSLTNLLQTLAGGGVAGAVIGVAAAIGSRIFGGGGRQDRPRVIVDEYSARAQEQMKQDPVIIRESTSINNAAATDEQLRQLDYLLRRMDRRRGHRRGANL